MAVLRKLGRYELVRMLGKGAMGVVYEGLDPALGRRVAVKTILKSAGLDADTERAYAQRFTQEARAVARLNHPHIVQVYDFGVEGDIAYLVMEFIEGRELRSLFEAGEKIDTGEAVRIMCELLEALEFAHQAGVIHRDVKPANVMLDAQRRAKLAEFGVARIQEGERTQADTMVGSPAYMSPEQISGVKIDHRTDIFAAGIILYQFLTGAKPFRGEGSWAVLAAIAQEEPVAPSEVAGGIPQAFDEVVAKALAKNPADRFATAREFAAALRDALGQPVRPTAPAAGRPRRVVAALAAGTAVAVACAAYLWSGRPAPQTAAPPAPVQAAALASQLATPAAPAADESAARAAAERLEKARQDQLQALQTQAAASRAVAERVAVEKAVGKLVQEKLAAEKAAARAAQDKLAAEQAVAAAATERAAAEKASAELAAAKAAADKAVADKAAADKAAADRRLAERKPAPKTADRAADKPAERPADKALAAAAEIRAFANEDKDWGIAPVAVPRLNQLHSPTPRTIAGARVLTTLELKRLLDADKSVVVVDVLDSKTRTSVPGAWWMPGAGQGKFFAAEKARFADTLARLTGGNLGRPVVFLCLSAECWLSYNASLRALEAGYTNVSWYRGGTDAWTGAGFARRNPERVEW